MHTSSGKGAKIGKKIGIDGLERFASMLKFTLRFFLQRCGLLVERNNKFSPQKAANVPCLSPLLFS
jgi:hypothetical protein